MDLIREYYSERDYIESIRNLELKRRKISIWKSSMKSRAATLAMLSAKELKKLKHRIKPTASTKSFNTLEKNEKSVEEFNNDYNKLYSSSLLEPSHTSLGDRSAKRAHSQKLTNPIDKFAAFEAKTRQSFHLSYEAYFPDTTDVIEDVLNLMFEKTDDSYKKSLKVNTMYLPYVPDATVKYVGEKFSLWEQINDLVKADIEITKKYKQMPSSAFGRTFRNISKNSTDKDDFKSKWESYSQDHAYHQELETFAAVWKNITNLQTTRKFCVWLANHSQVEAPAYLEDQGLVKKNMPCDYSAMSIITNADYVTPETIVEQRPFRKGRQVTLDKLSMTSSDTSSSYVSKDISDINIIV